jgi:hypothetical protein
MKESILRRSANCLASAERVAGPERLGIWGLISSKHYRGGRTELVLAAAGFAPAQSADASIQTLQNQILDTMLTSVVEGLEAEKVSKSDNPLLEPVLSIVAVRQKERITAQPAMQRPSPAEAIRLTFQWPPAPVQPLPNDGIHPPQAT